MSFNDAHGDSKLNNNLKDDDLKTKKTYSSMREEGNYSLKCINIFHNRTRFFLMILVLLCLTSIWSNILSFNFAIICINYDNNNPNALTNDQNGMKSPDNAISNITALSLRAGEDDSRSLYTARQRLYLTSAVAAAAILSNFVVVSLVNQFGIRSMFTLLGLLSGFSTCLLPMAINLGFYYVLLVRVLQGVAFSISFPVIGSFTSKWTYYKQNGLFVSALVAYVQLAPAVTMPISGALCTSSWGWPSVFFSHGLACIVLLVAFAVFYRNSPAKHSLVNAVELRKIAIGKSKLSKELLKNIPYLEIIKTASVWAVWIGAIGNFFCVNMMFLYSPNFLHNVLKFPVRNTGFSASLPPLAQFMIKLLAGLTSDKIRCLSETNKLKVYNSIAFFGSAFFLTLLAFTPTEYSTICLMLLGLAAGILGCTTGGFFKAGPLVSKHYSHFVTGNISLGITITMLIVPIMITEIAPNHTASEWRIVFLCTAAVLVITNSFFVLMASAKPALWTTDDFSRNASGNKIHTTAPENFAKLSAGQVAIA